MQHSAAMTEIKDKNKTTGQLQVSHQVVLNDVKTKEAADNTEMETIYEIEDILGSTAGFTAEEDQKKLSYSAKLVKKLLIQKEARLGWSHPETMNIMNIKALHPKEGSRKSEDIYRHNLLLCSRFEAVEEDKSEMSLPYSVCRITAENNLACLLCKKHTTEGRIEAAELLSDALLTNNEIYGVENGVSHTIYHNLGNVSRLSGDHKSAAKYYEKALIEKKKDLVVLDTIQILDTQKSLASSLYSAGDYIASEKIYRDILPVLINQHGVSNYITLKCRKLIVNTLIQQNKLIEAEDTLFDILQLLQSVPSQLMIGAHLQYIRRVESQIADLMYKKRNYVEAEKMYIRALPSKKENVYDSLAQTLIQLGKFSEAFDFYREVLDRRQISFGPCHPATIHAICIFADLYVRSNQLNDGLQYYQRALLSYEQELGENYLTLFVVDNIGKIYEKMKNFLEAEKYFFRALIGLENTIGEAKEEFLFFILSFFL